MRKILSVIAVLILYFSVLGGCQQTSPIIILYPKIFAGVIKEIKPLFEKAYPGYDIKLDVYPIRPMLSDILKGKQGDIFLSTGDVELSYLYERDLLKRLTETIFAEASVVALAVPGKSPWN